MVPPPGTLAAVPRITDHNAASARRLLKKPVPAGSRVLGFNGITIAKRLAPFGVKRCHICREPYSLSRATQLAGIGRLLGGWMAHQLPEPATESLIHSAYTVLRDPAASPCPRHRRLIAATTSELAVSSHASVA